MVQRYARARRDLLTGVSHHLRTPLAAMQGYLELLLLRQAELSPPERHNYVETAVRQCERLTRLVGAMSQLAELDADAPGLRREDFTLAELAHDVAQKHAAVAARRGITLTASADETVQGQAAAPAARGDIGLVERALAQLVDNALRHTPPGGRVTIGYGGDSGGGDRVRLAVSDTGEGIAAADLRTLFGRHADGDAPAGLGRLPAGGLGIAIAQRIAELHGGALDAHSARGQGTTVAFSLPAAGQAAAGAAFSPAPQRMTPAARAAAPESGRLAQLERECAALRAALERNDAARSAAEADLRAAEQRYLLALRGSQDGLWEWDIASDRVHLSPRWMGLLGYETHELGDDRATWLACIHADDRAAFAARCNASAPPALRPTALRTSCACGTRTAACATCCRAASRFATSAVSPIAWSALTPT